MLSNDAVEGLTRLVWEGPDHPITPAALHAIANLAADNKQAQDALREAGIAAALTIQCHCFDEALCN